MEINTQGVTADNLEALRAPFDPTSVSWRIASTTQDKKKGLAVAYITARDIMTRLDSVCGPFNWQDKYTVGTNGRTICSLAIRVCRDTIDAADVWEWVTKSDGAGETAMDGDKGAHSDAFKRAAVKWGIARYLWETDNQWVRIKSVGEKSYKIEADELPNLAASLPRIGEFGMEGNAPETDVETVNTIYTRCVRYANEAGLGKDHVNRTLRNRGYTSTKDPGLTVDIMRQFEQRYCIPDDDGPPPQDLGGDSKHLVGESNRGWNGNGSKTSKTSNSPAEEFF